MLKKKIKLAVTFSSHTDDSLSAEFVNQMAALLHGDGVRFFGEQIADLRQIAVPADFVLDFGGVVDESEIRVQALVDLRETFCGRRYGHRIVYRE